MTDSDIIASLARKVEILEDKLDHAEDSLLKRKQWIDKAKQDAGYSANISFDEVWDAALKALKEKQNKPLPYTERDVSPRDSNHS